MTSSSLPLTDHPSPDSIVAWRPDGPVSRDQFLADVAQLATRFPPGGHILNVCQDRYHFLVGLSAAAVSGRVSLLPPNLTEETVARLSAATPDLVCLHDGQGAVGNLPSLGFPAPAPLGAGKLPVPHIPVDRVIAHVYTSGSTGVPGTHYKTWGSLVVNGLSEAERLGAAGHALVGTVPAQHMYGFESTVLICLHGRAALSSGRPFYPADIAAALAAVPRPRALVTTPFHLRALLDAGVAVPPLDFILSATAPLSEDLARRAEAALGAPLLEIYGCTETGQLASRRSTATRHWHLLGDVRLSPLDDRHAASGGHIDGLVPLGDVLEPVDERHFILHGRNADLINIAGKRTSLAYLNEQLCGIPGVVDGAFLMPDDEPDDHVTRLRAAVVAPGLAARDILAALRLRIDPIFLPRPLIFVDRLPRNAASKLPRADLQALFAAHDAVHRGAAR